MTEKPGMMLHCGAHNATIEEVLAVPKPAHTRTHRPIDYGTLIQFVERQVERMGLVVSGAAFALNSKGQHFFAKWVLELPEHLHREDHTLSIVARQSYNKQFKLGIGIGTHTFICDNLSMSASDFKEAAKNTVNGWDNFRGRVLVFSDDYQAADTPEPLKVFEAVTGELDHWQGLDVSERDGARFLGELVYNGAQSHLPVEDRSKWKLTPQQASVAFQDWRKPRHEAFEPRTVYSLYNCVTEGLKRGPVATIGERHGSAHTAFQTLALQG